MKKMFLIIFNLLELPFIVIGIIARLIVDNLQAGYLAGLKIDKKVADESLKMVDSAIKWIEKKSLDRKTS